MGGRFSYLYSSSGFSFCKNLLIQAMPAFRKRDIETTLFPLFLFQKDQISTNAMPLLHLI